MNMKNLRKILENYSHLRSPMKSFNLRFIVPYDGF